MRNFILGILVGLAAAPLALAQLDTKALEKSLHEAGKNLENATKTVVKEANKSAKQVDKSLRQSSLYDDAVGAAQRMWTSLESGLKKTFSTGPSGSSAAPARARSR